MQPATSRFYEFGPFRVDAAKRVALLRDGEPVSLSPKAFDTLLVLAQHAGEVLEKDQLMDLLWPDSC
jgi:DNA-binding winged helix-turn-helix (wHTH) protein